MRSSDLADFDARKARVVELRDFDGLTRDEVADVLGLTLATVKRDLALACRHGRPPRSRWCWRWSA